MQLLIEAHDRRAADATGLSGNNKLVDVRTVHAHRALLHERRRSVNRRVGCGDAGGPECIARRGRGRTDADEHADRRDHEDEQALHAQGNDIPLPTPAHNRRFIHAARLSMLHESHHLSTRRSGVSPATTSAPRPKAVA